MTDNFIDFHNSILWYNDNEKIFVVFKDGTNKPYVNVNDIGKLLGYLRPYDAAQTHASEHI